jgi:ADP-ribose pyrophosphatase YjhB (NUDIX family)
MTDPSTSLPPGPPDAAGASGHPRVACAGAVIVDEHGLFLLIRRGQEPSAGTWSIPGGRVEPGETPAAAAVREAREETGLHVDVQRWVGRVERAGPAATYVIDDFACTVVGGRLSAGDDAVDVDWFDLAGPVPVRRGAAAGAPAEALAPQLVEALVAFGCLTPPASGAAPSR